MSRPQSLVERVEHLLEDSAPDEIAVLLNISEAEVRGIALLLDERGPADPKPLPAEDVQAVAVEVEDLPDEPVIYGDDIRRLLSDDPDHADSLARRALLTVAEHSETQHDVEDLAGMLGLTGALTDWQPSVQGPGNPSGNSWGVPAPQAPMSEPGDATTGEQGPSIPVENHATPQVSEASSPPIDKMRELADDGLEPWQIAAALGVREDAVLVALAADEPAGGAQRAVEVAALAAEMAETFTAIDEAVDAITPEHIEARLAEVLASAPEQTWGADAIEAPMSAPGDATTVDPQKPDTLAPTRPMTRALAEHVAGYADGMAIRRCEVCRGPVDDDGTDRTQCHRCRIALAAVSGATIPGVLVCGPIDDEDDGSEDYAQPDDDPAEGPRCPDCGSEDCQVIPYCSPAVDDVDDANPIQADERSAHEMPSDVTPSEHVRLYPEPNQASAVTVTAHLVELMPPEHVHEPFPVVDEAGVWHAECECGTRWDRSPCEYSGCTAYVSALHIARTGTSRHAHHPGTTA